MAGKQNVNGIAVFAAVGGAVLLYSGIQGKSVSGAIRNILMGQSPATAASSFGITGTSGADLPAGVSPIASATGPVASRNQALGRLLAAPYGWSTGAQWDALVALWTRESHWDNHAQNPSSTAYGIAQFLDDTWATVGGSKTSDAATQIRLGLKYIKQRYGNPVNAMAHENSAGWY